MMVVDLVRTYLSRPRGLCGFKALDAGASFFLFTCDCYLGVATAVLGATFFRGRIRSRPDHPACQPNPKF